MYIMKKLRKQKSTVQFKEGGYEVAGSTPPNNVTCMTAEDRGYLQTVDANRISVVQIFDLSESTCDEFGLNTGTSTFPCHAYYMTEDDYNIQIAKPALDRLNIYTHPQEAYPSTALLNKAEVNNISESATSVGNIIGMTFLDPEIGSIQAVTNNFTQLDPKMMITFAAPITTNVMIETSFFRDSVNSDVNLYMRLTEGGTIITEKKLSRADETDDFIVNHAHVIQGLTAGEAYTYKIEFKRDGFLNIAYGGAHPAFIVKAIAVPALLLT